MKPRMRGLLGLVGVLGVLVLAGCNADGTSNAVKWSDIHGWKSVGSRWAEALDEKGQMIALYDLSYPFLGDRICVGTLSTKPLDVEAIIRLIKASRSSRHLESVQARNVEQALFGLEEAKKQGSLTNIFHDNWWKEIPWQQSGMSSLSDALPARFNLGNIDYHRIVKDPKAFDAKINQAENIRDESDGRLLLGKDFLNRFEFVRAGDGSYYEIYWTPPKLGTEFTSRPKKVADLRERNAGLYYALATEAITDLLGAAIGQITLPIVSGLVSAAADELFHWESTLRTNHHEMVREMVNTAEAGATVDSPFSPFTVAERRQIAEYVVLAESTLVDGWTWIFRNPETAWRKSVERETNLADQTRLWLRQENETLDALNPRFGRVTSSSGKRYLDVLAYKDPWGKGEPSVAVDYANLDAIRNFRAGVEASATAVHFASSFIPYSGGSVVNWAFDELIRNPVIWAIEWEARLTVHLEERVLESGEAWDQELGILDAQRVNGLEIDRKGMNQLIQERKKSLGLP